MCGIVGILAGKPETDTAKLSAALLKLSGSLENYETYVREDHEGDAPALEPFELLLEELRGFYTVFFTGCSGMLRNTLYEILERIENILRKIETLPDERLNLAKREEINRMKIVFLDARWQISRDIGDAIKGVEFLNGGPWKEKDIHHVHHLWRLDCCLRNIGRIEVRGRDSAGFSVMITFEDRSSYDSFFSDFGESPFFEKLKARKGQHDFSAFSVIGGEYPGLIFTYKIAKEIGKMGENVAKLRDDIRSDDLLQALLRAPGSRLNVLAHTRWASNGVISEANAHPQDSRSAGDSAESARICAVLNGDIDNYLELLAEFRERTSKDVLPTITTDAKIIPLLIGEKFGQSGDFALAFRETVRSFEGSFAIAAHHIDEPGKIYLALKGSGQSLYIGPGRDCLVAASELYGVVETSHNFMKMNGEWVSGSGETGQIVVLDQGVTGNGDTAWKGFSFDGTPLPVGVLELQKAQITTRDICIGKWSHYFLKEVNESVSSVEKTLRGRFSLHSADGGMKPRMLLDDSVVPRKLVEKLVGGIIKRVVCIGQGTAGVAAAGVAVALEKYLANLDLDIQAVRASEFSGHHLYERMDDCLVVAVSQSGTTADTNRTVDLVRARGALCLSIVNRRNSDLVYKSDGVFYTSDGRDVEMSVASTKAFYSQVTAGYLLALHLAAETSSIGEVALRRGLEALNRLPAALQSVMDGREAIDCAARKYALCKRHWACVGSGSNYVAAQEIRIKLSELCYKSIACDFLEDKKHIDLSSEPLILVCATGLDTVTLADAVKETAIFRAHQSTPIVFAAEGAELFRPYAASVIECPTVGEGLDFIPQVMAGHLFGFFAARAIDEKALPLRALRTNLVEAVEGGTSPDLDPARGIINDILLEGSVTAALDCGAACRLMDCLLTAGEAAGNSECSLPPAILQNTINALTEAINQLTRPIDAIKHQAKTVTVGITREEIQLCPPFALVFSELGLSASMVSRSNLELLRALSPLVRNISGASYYVVKGLSATGRPRKNSTCRRLKSWGAAASMKSRTETASQLKGTKWLCVKERSPFIGTGRNDGKTIAIIPLAAEGPGTSTESALLLFHVEFTGSPEPAVLAKALKRYAGQYDRIVAAATELDIEWDDSLLGKVPVVELFDESLTSIIESIKRR